MKRNFLVMLVLVLSAVSCSAVFEGGLSGQVYDGDGESGYSDVMVYAYDSEKKRNADYESFLKGGNVDSSGNFVPNSKLYVPKVRTNANGEFTISKIVWKTKTSKFGKTDDVHNLYLMYYADDARDTKFVTDGTQRKLIKEEHPYKIVSGSTNQASSYKTLYRDSKKFGGVSGYVRNTQSSPAANYFGQVTDDGVTLKLHYYDASCTGVSGDGESFWKDASKNISESKEEYKRNGSVSTEATNERSAGESVSVSATHGNFAGLGTGAEFRLIYNDDEDLGYVWLCVERVSASGESTYSQAKKIYADNFTWLMNYSSSNGDGFYDGENPRTTAPSHSSETNSHSV